MATYQINHSCGHTQDHLIYGSIEERDRKREQMALGPCSKCYHLNQTELARIEAQNLGLPELEGSEKQVAWALQLRRQAIAILLPIRKQVVDLKDHNPQFAAKALEAIDKLFNHNRASWWINNRGMTFGRSWLAEQVKAM